MYSGMELTKYSGRVMGAHQKLDRIAHKYTKRALERSDYFPELKHILLFEGRNGPDGIKMKSPGSDEPWHYLNPFNEQNEHFNENVSYHYKQLVKALKRKDEIRSGFEAAWLAHTVVDGLTPPHHYPYTEKIESMRAGSKKNRTTKAQKILFAGASPAKTLKNMYAVYGPRGLFTAHFSFEHGSGIIMRPLKLPEAHLTDVDIEKVSSLSPDDYFKEISREVAAYSLFDRYLKYGFTTKLAREIRHMLAPAMAKTITALWYKAAKEANK